MEEWGKIVSYGFKVLQKAGKIIKGIAGKVGAFFKAGVKAVETVETVADGLKVVGGNNLLKKDHERLRSKVGEEYNENVVLYDKGYVEVWNKTCEKLEKVSNNSDMISVNTDRINALDTGLEATNSGLGSLLAFQKATMCKATIDHLSNRILTKSLYLQGMAKNLKYHLDSLKLHFGQLMLISDLTKKSSLTLASLQNMLVIVEKLAGEHENIDYKVGENELKFDYSDEKTRVVDLVGEVERILKNIKKDIVLTKDSYTELLESDIKEYKGAIEQYSSDPELENNSEFKKGIIPKLEHGESLVEKSRGELDMLYEEVESIDREIIKVSTLLELEQD